MSKPSLNISIARVYDLDPTDNRYRVLVDRIWPRGVKKADLKLDAWMKVLAPSDRLRKWFNHDPKRWNGFCKRYHEELDQERELVTQLLQTARGRPVLLLYGARDVEHNNAVALKQFLESRCSNSEH